MLLELPSNRRPRYFRVDLDQAPIRCPPLPKLAGTASQPSSLTLRESLLSPVACLVTEMSLFPYEAYWQPRTVDGRFPIYAPVEAEFEFGSYRECGARVWATTRRQQVPHDTSGMTLRLERPMLVLGGEARLNLVGRVQRQTFEIAGEYYTCVQHVGMSGMRVVGLKAEAGVAEGGGWSLEMSEEKQCGMCGGFKGGRGAHKVEKLVKCGWCKTEWYCGKGCRELLSAFLCLSSVPNSFLGRLVFLPVASAFSVDLCACLHPCL